MEMFRLSRAAYVTSSSSLAHGSSGPMPLQLPMYRSQHQQPPEPPVTGLLGGQQPTSNLPSANLPSAPVYGLPVHIAYKRPAMLSSEYGQSSGRRALLEPLKIDTELKKVAPLFPIVATSFLHIFFLHFCRFLLSVKTIASSFDNMCAVPRTHNTFGDGDRSYGAAAPRIWNSLPRGLRTLDINYNYKQLKMLLKTYV